MCRSLAAGKRLRIARRVRAGRLLIVSLLICAAASAAAEPDASATSPASGSESFVDAWFANSDAAKEAQPHWMTPVVTVTPRLEQEYRYDQSWQNRGNFVDQTSYGGGKGLELIPTANTELIIGVPAYQTRNRPAAKIDGLADDTLLLKYRFSSANEEHGNYIVTGFMGVSVPTGGQSFTEHTAIYTPTIAAGKGWGTRDAGFDIQSTLGISLPGAYLKDQGRLIGWNTALQAHVFEKLWPEIEANYTHYKDGPDDGKNQLALTAGVVAGRFEVTRRIRLILGGGYQKTLSTFHTFNHTWLVTARAAF
jgi:hypothetical protein